MAEQDATEEEWEAAVREAYRRDVVEEEYQNKCATNPDALRKIAYYLKWTGYDILSVADPEADLNIILLFDFLNFTDGV